ncbi:rhamnogalacturonan acetylesterase [Cesiribacter sp. SM1]|uniref:rhamnogalacturonan acetylesterase n=1 Tax=Cesiribacter sp. SM1 TaxID=2861196 RepID=UPI001CD7A1CF|nr:rhamnogalacturonan acetylesterase [Cesiribacter sp. SM1]
MIKKLIVVSTQHKLPLLFLCLFCMSFLPLQKRPVKMYLIGDSTMADYSLYEGEDYQRQRYPLMGWGQVFQPFMSSDSLSLIKHLVKADSVLVLDKARGGRSTRTFFEEGRWTAVYNALEKGDIVLIQFGHNDAAENKPERYVNIQGYKEYLRLFVTQARQKGALPILLTPVARNYPWKNGRLSNVHGEYPGAVKEVARELNVPLIDLNQRSMDHFSAKGEEWVSNNYFMNLPAGEYQAYPDGQKDNTHFQPEGAKAVASLVFEGLQDLKPKEAAKQ